MDLVGLKVLDWRLFNPQKFVPNAPVKQLPLFTSTCHLYSFAVHEYKLTMSLAPFFSSFYPSKWTSDFFKLSSLLFHLPYMYISSKPEQSGISRTWHSLKSSQNDSNMRYEILDEQSTYSGVGVGPGDNAYHRLWSGFPGWEQSTRGQLLFPGSVGGGVWNSLINTISWAIGDNQEKWSCREEIWILTVSGERS